MTAAPAVVTGLGVVSGAGTGAAALWACAAEGRDVLTQIRRFTAPELAGVVPGHAEVTLVGDGGAPAQALCVAFAVSAAREAIADAGLDLAADRIALVFGTNLYDRPTPMSGLAAAIADELGLTGPRLAVSTACASSATAIALALHLLADDRVDAVLAGGSDVLTPLVVAAFRSLRLAAPGRCAPFSTPVGLSLGEGAAFLALERPARAAARGRTPASALLAGGLAADAFHPTSPDPRGEGVTACVRRALRRGGVDVAELAYINAHATGTDNNDVAEWRGLARVLGARAADVPVSASKSILGHAQGAAGALEAALTLLGHRRGLAPPTLRHVGSRPGVAADAIAEGRPRPLLGDAVVSVNAGFGGACTALLFAAADRTTPTPRPRRVWLRGAASPGTDAAEALRTVQAAGLDPGTRALLGAAILSLGTDAPAARDGDGRGCGLFVAQRWVSPTLVRAVEEAGRRRGYDRVQAAHSARGLLISPAGATACALGLRGPLAAFSAGPAAALAALTLAADEIAGADDVAWMLAAAVDEPDAGDASAGCVVLADTPDLAAPIALLGHAIAGPGQLAAAIHAALARADLADLQAHDAGPLLAGLHAACGALRARRAPHVLVVADDPGALACATVWGYSPAPEA